MTNALAQNIEQNQNSNAIDLMMQVVNSSNQTKTQGKKRILEYN